MRDAADEDFQQQAQYRAVRKARASSEPWSWGEIVTGGIGSLVVLAFSDGDAWQNIILPFVGFVVGALVWHFVCRPVYRYIWTVPEEEHVALWRRLQDTQAKVDSLEHAQLFRVGLSTVLGVHCHMAWSKERIDAASYEIWALVTNLVLTNQTDHQLPLSLSVVFGMRGSNLRKVGVASPVLPPEWVLRLAESHLQNQSSFLANPVNLAARTSMQGYCAVRMSERWLAALNVETPQQISDDLPRWLEVRNNLHQHGQLIQFELNRHAVAIKLAKYGIGLVTVAPRDQAASDTES